MQNIPKIKLGVVAVSRDCFPMEVKDTAEDLPMVQITKSGKLYLNDQPINNINLIGSDIEKRFKDQKSVYVVADKRGQVDTMVQVLSALNRAHFKVSIVAKEQELAKP